MVDFSKYKKGDVVTVHCCDSCTRESAARSCAEAINRKLLVSVMKPIRIRHPNETEFYVKQNKGDR